MNHTYVKAHHEHCPDQIGWYRYLESGDDPELIDFVTQQTIKNVFGKLSNVHFEKSLNMINLSPLDMTARWLQTFEKIMHTSGRVFINSQGGLTTGSELKIMETVKTNKPDFPATKDEIITISKWGNNTTHWYLKSSIGRILSQKFRKFDDAKKYALTFVDEARIKEGNDIPYFYKTEGD